MNIYYNLNKTLDKNLINFPSKRKKISLKKLSLAVFRGAVIFLILAMSFKIVSLPGISFFLEAIPKLASIPMNASITVPEKSDVPKLERPESIEAKAAKNFNLLPFSAIKTKKLQGENDGQVNFLLLGIGGKDNPAPYLADSIIVASLNIKDEPKAVFISIPRDLVVRIPNGYLTKINSLYILDKNKLKNLEHLKLFEKTIEEITSLEIHYFIVMELEGLGKLVDAVGGVKIFVEEPIYDPRFPTPNRGYETFMMPAGWQYLSGETAEKYARTRHTKENDYGRMARQQQIIEAAGEKVINLNLLSDLPTFLEIERILSSHFETNLTKEEGARILEIAQNFKKENIIQKVIDPSTGLMSSGTMDNLGFVLWPRIGQFDYSEIKEFVSDLVK